jgi:hypothetical protein
MTIFSCFSWIPKPSHPGASCDERERNGALAAIVACFLLAIGLVIAAILLVPEGDPSTDAGLATAGGGYGTGSGDGFGAGTGSGSALAGKGPGAGVAGSRKGVTGDASDTAPRGQLAGTVAQANAREGESLVTGEAKELPKFGFTLPDKNDPIDPPQTAVAVGRRDGRDGAGAAGAGGGGGAGFMGIPEDAKSIVYVLDFSASMRDGNLKRESELKRELARSIQALPKDGKFTVILFGRSPGDGAQVVTRADGSTVWRAAWPMPPEGALVPATPANRSAAVSWVNERSPDAGGSSYAWDSMEMALALKPEAIYLLTDGEFDSYGLNDLMDAIRKGNADRQTRIHTVALGSPGDVASLQGIAADNGGSYRWVELTPGR